VSVEVRACGEVGEMRRALVPIWQFFGSAPDDGTMERFPRVLPVERMLAAWEGQEIVGGGGSFPFSLTVPGGEAGCAGVTVVGVHPTHRRRGVLTQLMRAQLDDVHARGEPLAALWASEAPIYGRFGYGVASLCGDVDLARERTAFHDGHRRTAPARFLELDEALEQLPPIYDRVCAATPGMFRRTRDWWEVRVLLDPEARREGAGPHRRVLVELPDGEAGYAIYRHQPKWEDASAVSSVHVVEALGTSPAATKEVWRYLLDMDWTAWIKGQLLAVDHPLFLLLAEPRRLRFRLSDALWLRLVDVGAALSARSYAAGERIVLDVRDEFCPWNEGRWALEGGEAHRTDGEPDLRLGVADLGAVYLGGFTFADLWRAGRVEELVAGALGRADGLFRSDVKPWCPEIF